MNYTLWLHTNPAFLQNREPIITKWTSISLHEIDSSLKVKSWCLWLPSYLHSGFKKIFSILFWNYYFCLHLIKHRAFYHGSYCSSLILVYKKGQDNFIFLMIVRNHCTSLGDIIISQAIAAVCIGVLKLVRGGKTFFIIYKQIKEYIN